MQRDPNAVAAAASIADQAQRWSGALEGQHETLIYGWAIDHHDPDARVVVEICLNGDPFGCVIADVARTDMAKQFSGDVCHGFIADLGALTNKGKGMVTARIANLGFSLSGQLLLDEPTAAPLSAVSNVYSDGGLRLLGWAIDPERPDLLVDVRAYLGDRLLASARANIKQPGVGARYDQSRGFKLDLPLELADGKVHEVRVMDARGRSLNGSPISVCFYADGATTLLPASDKSPLFVDVIAAYERHLPRSLGMQYYADWAARFESSNELSAPVDPTLNDSTSIDLPNIAVIITGVGDTAASIASLNAQRNVRGLAYIEHEQDKSPQSFSALLKLAMASGADVVTFLRAGDTLAPHALALATQALQDPSTQVVYTDSETIDANAKATPWFKPAWNPEYAFASDYVMTLMLVRTRLLAVCFAKQNALPNNAAAFAWRVLQHVWQGGVQAISHVPHVLYSFRSALTEDERSARARAAQQALTSIEPGARLQAMPMTVPAFDHDQRQLTRPLAKKRASVTLIIPTRDRKELLERCIVSIRRYTKGSQLEIIVVDNDSTDKKTLDYFKAIRKQGVKVLQVKGVFNFARLNNRAVEVATGDIIGMINNDIEALHKGWLDEMLSHLARPEVGAVGAKLLWPNGMVQHGGVLLGIGNVAGHYGNMLTDADHGDHGRNRLTHQVSAVTAACLFMRKADYLAIGGMDEGAFPVAFNDVDLCLRLRARGQAIVWTAQARLLHAESASRGQEDSPQKRARAQREIAHLRQRWSDVLLNDPFYHPSLNLDAHGQAFGGLALPPRRRMARKGMLVPETGKRSA